jgi:mono/diheme cytochrome c family protein
MGHSHRLGVLCGVVALTVVIHHGAHGQEPPPAGAPAETAADAAPSGSELYLRHCAICHGIDGRGHGPLTEAMKIVPADLTRVTVRSGGTFPDAKVSDVIRNGGGVLGHGSMAMLPWGIYFSERRNPAVGKARIKALVAYIKSIQEK